MKFFKELFLIVIVTLVVITVYRLSGESDLLTPDSHEGSMKFDADSDEDEAVGRRLAVIEGVYAIRLPESIQAQAGIQAEPVIQKEIKQTVHAFGEVISIQPLLSLRARMNQLTMQKKVAEADLSVSGREYERLRKLHEDAENISERQMLAAKSKWLTDQTALQSISQGLEDLRYEAYREWGSRLVDAMIDGDDVFKIFDRQDARLIQVTLSADQQLPADVKKIFISRDIDSRQKIEAEYLSPAMTTNPMIQGETYYFYAISDELRNGMYLDAWFNPENASVTGYQIPESAIIWYVDRPWVYVRKDEQHFVRKYLENYIESREGWLVTDDFFKDKMVVTRGGQMLLAEEFRWSIPDEDDNP